MQKIAELIIGIIIFTISNQGYTGVLGRYGETKATTMESIVYGKKSCPDGFVENVDYFVMTGSIKITDQMRDTFRRAYALIRYENEWGKWFSIRKAWIFVRNATCADVNYVPANSCVCLSKSNDAREFRVKCNITMECWYSEAAFKLCFIMDYAYCSPIAEHIGYVYNNTACQRHRYTYLSRNEGPSLLGGNSFSGVAIVLTTFVIMAFTMSSL